MSPRTGRPVVGQPKDKYLSVRTDEDMLRKIDQCAEKTKQTKVAVVRQAIDLLWNQLFVAKK